MKKALSVLILAAALLTACAPGTPSGDAPVNSDTPGVSEPANYLPRPDDFTLRREPVNPDSANLLSMESFPLQFSLLLKGNLPTPCNQLRIQVERPDTAGIIAVDLYSVVDPKTMCVEVLQPFEVSVPLGSFPSGHYKLMVNGKQVAEFDA